MRNKMYENEMEKELHRLLFVLMNGTREEFKKAKKEIEVLWKHETETFKSSAHVALGFLPKFDQIENVINKEAFLSGLSFFYLTLADDYFDMLKSFTLNTIQHPHGHIREAIRKTSDWLFCSLTSRADPFIYPEGKELSDKQKTEQIISRKQYLGYVKDVETLIEKYEVGDDGIEYVDDMKPSINKSLQQIWNRLTECPTYRKILEETTAIPLEIFVKRKEIEGELLEMLKDVSGDIELVDIKDMIYNEDEVGDMQKIIAIFDDGNVDNLSNILETISDAWNYFPHKSLGGLSPQEKLSEYKVKQI
jgi:hypothetical protein